MTGARAVVDLDSRIPADEAPRGHRGVVALTVFLVGQVLASACYEDQTHPPGIFFDVDYGACPGAACIRSVQIHVLKGPTLASACLVGVYDLGGSTGTQSVDNIPIQLGDPLSLVFLFHCAESCDRCAAVKEGLIARDRLRVSLKPAPSGKCLMRDDIGVLVPNVKPCTAADAGLDRGPDGDQGPAKDTGTSDKPLADRSCKTFYDCAKKCQDGVCNVACQYQTCAAAVTLSSDLMDCALLCFLDCHLGGFGSPKCEPCLKTQCSKELADCLAHLSC